MLAVLCDILASLNKDLPDNVLWDIYFHTDQDRFLCFLCSEGPGRIDLSRLRNTILLRPGNSVVCSFHKYWEQFQTCVTTTLKGKNAHFSISDQTMCKLPLSEC